MADNLFDRFPLFQELAPVHRQALQVIFTPCEFQAGTTLFEQGDPADSFYLVVEGVVSILYKPDDGPVITITHVRRGGVVGWSAALGNPAYTSAAICDRATQLLRVRGYDLRRLCDQCPDMGEVVLDRLATIIAERLMHSREQIMTMIREGLSSSLC